MQNKVVLLPFLRQWGEPEQCTANVLFELSLSPWDLHTARWFAEMEAAAAGL